MGRGVTILLVIVINTAYAELVVPIDIGPVAVLTGSQTGGARDGLLSNATFNAPRQMLVSPFDDSFIFVADNSNNLVRRIDLTQATVITWLGSGAQIDAPGTGTGAGLAIPYGLLVDPNDERFLFLGCLVGIRRVDMESAQVSTFTGIGEGYVEGAASKARFRQVQGMVAQSNTLNLIVTDQVNYRIRRVNSVTGFTSLVAGDGTAGGNDGTAESATFSYPIGVVFYPESSTVVMVSDYSNFCLRRVNVTSRAVTTLSPCFTAGMEDGALTSARFSNPHTLTRPAWSAFAYLADLGNHRIRRIDLDGGVVATVVGAGTAGWQGSQSSVSALIDRPVAVMFGCRGVKLTMYVSGHFAIATVDMSKTADIGSCRPTAVNIGPVTLLAGQGTVSGAADAPALSAFFALPQNVLCDGRTLIIPDQANHAIRRLNLSTNVVDTWVGMAGQPGLVPLAGNEARLINPCYAIDHPLHEFQIIVLVSAALVLVDRDSAQVTILSGQEPTGYAEGAASAARFKYPSGVIAHPNLNDLILADTHNYRLRRISLGDGSTAHLVGSAPSSIDGEALTGHIWGPVGLARLPRAGPSNQLYVGDFYGHCMRGVSLENYSVTSLTPCGAIGHRDGGLRTAGFSYPGGFTAVPASRSVGGFLVAEYGANRIRMVDMAAGGWVMTVAGTGSPGWSPSAVSSLAARLNMPTQVTFHLRASNDLVLYISFTNSIAMVNTSLTLRPRETFTTTQALARTASSSAQPTGSRTDQARTETAPRRRSSPTLNTAPRRTATLLRRANSRISTTLSPSMSRARLRVDPSTTFSTRRWSHTLTMQPEKYNTAPQGTVDVGRSAVVPVTARIATTAVAAVATALVGLVGLPVAARPAVAGAAIRMSTCVADGADGPEVPPYEAMPAQFAVLGTPAATAGSAVLSNAAVVLLGLVGGYAAAGNGQANPQRDKRNPLRVEPTSMRASMAHAASTAPFSYISPALVEFSVMWLSAAAAPRSTFTLGAWAAGFVVGLSVALGSWALLTWRGHAAAVDVRDEAGTSGRDGRWETLVGPLIAATRDVTSPRVRCAFFVELGCSLLFSALSGIRVESLCVAKCVAATLVALAFLGYLLIVQPAAERMDHWFGVGFAALQVLTGALLAAAVLDGRGRSGQDESSSSTWSSTAVDVAECVSLATLVLLVVQAVLGLIMAVRETCRCPGDNAQLDRHGLEEGLLVVPAPKPLIPDGAAGDRTARADHLTRGPNETSHVKQMSNPLVRQ
jgi:hypothetical protein